MMRPEDVVATLDALDTVEVRAWVEGGWGVDALVGPQTRDHDDVELAVNSDAEGFDRAIVASISTLCGSARTGPRCIRPQS